ncbi:MAG: hypothetical protein LQ350_000723 [Teloschistes chrysophthalmus]|nr:MAG: hypothetical protein LQ350_000723 [Niorma chrysophthalma]
MSDQFSNQSGTTGFDGFNMFNGNPLIDLGAAASLMQPNFGQTWSGSPGWGTVFDVPYQNNDYSQAQQTETFDHDENDDFYDNENTTMNSQLNPNGNQTEGRTAPLTPQQTIKAQPRGPSTTGQLNNHAKTHNSNITASPLSGAEAANRAAELREKLLANKRGSSATPVPSAATRKPNVTREATHVTQERKDHVNNQGKQHCTDATLETNQAVFTTANGQLLDKSLHNPPEVPRSSSATADIEGLIGEYRVPEASRIQAIPAAETRRVHHLKPPSILSKSISTTTPSRPHRGSVGSTESGEIHSDQELEINIKGRDQGRSVIEKAKAEIPKGPQKSAAVGVAKQRPMVDTHQSQSGPLNKAFTPETSRKNSLSQNVDRRAIVQPASKPRDIPLAQRADLVRKDVLQSPSPRGLNGADTQRHDSGSKGKDRGIHNLSDPVTGPETSQSETVSKTITEVPKHQHEQGQEVIGEHATVHGEPVAEPVAEQNPAAPQQHPAYSEQDTHEHEHATEHGKPKTNVSLAREDLTAKQKDQHSSPDIRSAAHEDSKTYTLTTAQYEKLHTLGVDLGPRGFDDLCDFLEHHKFHVESYRQKALARRKQFQDVEAEERAIAAKRLALERESHLEFSQFHTMPANFLVSSESESKKPIALAQEGVLETPSRKPMPPPLNLPKTLDDQGAATANLTTGNTSATDPGFHIHGHSTPRRDLPSDAPTSKRQYVDDEMELERGSKVARVDYDSRSYNRSRQVSPKTSRSEMTAGVAGPVMAHLILIEPSQHLPPILITRMDSAGIECIWATQSKNLDVLTEAFNTCRNVILVFSVNNSRAFQGYARMQSLPSSDIPTPGWQKQLRWSTTDPFRIEWFAIAETRFNHVGHLKNALNEGQAVLVGRDGQEIEGVCGRELCLLMDEEAREEERHEMDYY